MLQLRRTRSLCVPQGHMRKLRISGHQAKYCQKKKSHVYKKGKPTRLSYMHALSTKNFGKFQEGFLIDSGAQRHIVSSLILLDNARAQVMLANNQTMTATHTEDINSTSLQLRDALFVPNTRFTVKFTRSECCNFLAHANLQSCMMAAII